MKNLKETMNLIRQNPYRFHVIGAGQCGGNIARELETIFTGVEISVMNTNKADFDYIKGADWNQKTKQGNKLLISDGGTGRSLKVGATIIEQNYPLIKDFLISRLGTQVYDFVVLVIGFGGGTGTSFLMPVAKILKEMNQKTVLVASLPEMSLGLPALPNAGIALDQVQKNLDLFSNLFLVSNDEMLKRFGEGGSNGYWTHVNQAVCKNLLYMLNVNNLGITARSYGALDEKELLRVFTLGHGYGDLRILTYPIDKIKDVTEFRKAFAKESQVFLDSSPLSKTAAYGVAILTPMNCDQAAMSNSIASIFDGLHKTLGSPPFVLRGVFESQVIKDKVTVIAILSGMPKPQIVDRLIKYAQKNISKLKDRASDLPDVGIEALGLDNLNDNFLDK